MKRKLRIRMDFNGVIRNLEQVRQEIALKEFGRIVPGYLLKREVVVSEGIFTEEEYTHLIHLSFQEPYRLQGSPHPGARKQIERFLKAGHTVSVDTATNPEAFGVADNWLKKKRFPEQHDRFRVISVGKDGNKSEQLGVPDVILDDDFPHLQDAYNELLRAASVDTPIPRPPVYLFLFSRKYNRHVDTQGIATRVHSLKEFGRHVDHIARVVPIMAPFLATQLARKT